MYLPAWRRSPNSGEMIRYSADFLALGVVFMYLPAFTQILEALAKQWRDDPVRYIFWLGVVLLIRIRDSVPFNSWIRDLG